jgi:hypothetical protein
MEFEIKILELQILMKFGQLAPCYTLLSGKINLHQKGDQSVEFHSKWKI